MSEEERAQLREIVHDPDVRASVELIENLRDQLAAARAAYRDSLQRVQRLCEQTKADLDATQGEIERLRRQLSWEKRINNRLALSQSSDIDELLGLCRVWESLDSPAAQVCAEQLRAAITALQDEAAGEA